VFVRDLLMADAAMAPAIAVLQFESSALSFDGKDKAYPSVYAVPSGSQRWT
jgi:hypothetical protein